MQVNLANDALGMRFSRLAVVDSINVTVRVNACTRTALISSGKLRFISATLAA